MPDLDLHTNIANQIRLKTQGFRAINSADILLNGITVVAGENGSGKSTLSKVLYYLYKTASNYDKLVAKELQYNLRNVIRFLEIVVSDLRSLSTKRNTREEYNELQELRQDLETVDEDLMHKWILFVRRVENNFNSQPNLFKDESPLNSRLNTRLKLIIRDLLKIDETEEESGVPFKNVSKLLEKLFKEALEKIKSRPTTLFFEELTGLYSDGVLPKIFEVYEFGDQIVSLNKKSLSIPYLIQNSIYIDTPMMLDVEFSNNQYWDDLNDLLHLKAKLKYSDISNIISNEIINGDVSLDDSSVVKSDFSFKKVNGEVYNLLDCATGIKAFAILQILLKNGSLTDKTLLILDEPESNLHPQWIIEYARIIVLLNKEVGVKFFIASHNPDMVSAIRYISEKENALTKLNYYLAQKQPDSQVYNYQHLGTDIESIFESFNIAIDRINKYGV